MFVYQEYEGRAQRAVVRKARWDFAQLLEWQHFLVPVVREVVGRRGFGSTVSVVRKPRDICGS